MASVRSVSTTRRQGTNSSKYFFHLFSARDRPAIMRGILFFLVLFLRFMIDVPALGNNDIEEQIKRDGLAAKREVRALLLGTGRSNTVGSHNQFLRDANSKCNLGQISQVDATRSWWGIR